MKKLVIFLFSLLATHLFAAQVQTLSISTPNLATQYGWSDLQCPRNFDLNDAISVEVDSAGTMKYTKNTQQMHCYQWLGGFTIRAKAGYTIQSVKLSYFSVNLGVLTQYWGADGKEIPESDRIANNQVVEVNGSDVTFYVGTTGTNKDGQIRIASWEVVYTLPLSKDLMIRTATDLGKQYGWADATCPVHIPFNNALSLYSDQDNNVKYYSTTKSFHCYRWCGGFYFKARAGAVIKSICLYYESLNNGVLTQDWGSDGKNIPADDWISSGTVLLFNSDSVHFFIGDKSETSSCQIHITSFAIQYVDTTAHIETFALCPSKGSNETIDVVGDKGYYSWQMNHFQRGESDYMDSGQGTRLMSNGVVATNGVQEGGIKDLSFDWRAGDDSNPVSFSVQAGTTMDNVQRANPGSANYVMNYTKAFHVKQNTTLSVSIGAQAAPALANPIIGSITITPYLLFTPENHVDTVDTNRDTYDLKTRLINNSGEVPVFEMMENTIGEDITITNGVVDLRSVHHGGYIRVKASCFSGDVYTMLTLYIQVAPRVRFVETNKVATIADAPFVNPLIVPDSIGGITYSSSDSKVAMVNDTGLVTIVGLGQATITAHVAASEMYVATTASFHLSVVYTPKEGTYRVETFSQCKKKTMTEGFAYVQGDDAIYDWNLSYFSRDMQDSIAGERGILLYYGGSIASNGEQEGGIKYMAFNWRAVDPVAPVHFFVNTANTSLSYSSEAVGDAGMVLAFSHLFELKSNTSFSINLRAKENPAQSQMVVGPITIVPYLLFTNKYDEVELPRTSYNLAMEGGLIDNRDDETPITFSVVSAPAGIIDIQDGVLDLSGMEDEGDVVVKAQWGDVSTTMTVHLTMPTGLTKVHNAQCTMHGGKVLVNGELKIWHNGTWWTVMGEEMHNAQCTMKNE